MEWWFRPGDKLITIKHASFISKMLSWILKVNQARNNQWIVESENHINFYMFS
jgi:hypothetical protein